MKSKRTTKIIDPSIIDELQRQEDLAAIREGFADMEAGRTAPLVEAMERIRFKLGLPKD